ncbi:MULTISPECIES: azurin [Pseudomonas]|uniref:azurin n=1 Tax=Pseudomonas TaxID=286 RepID=UPI0004061A76|nr:MULTISPECIES: azurin [Pseudomonas]KIZ48683.1 azurin [Pseudomonas oryzihabitans]MBA1260300.1 azurin [Pseudomonas psychrotolerans]RAU37175.1 azurin [Pseudomonas sp. RIT 411]
MKSTLFAAALFALGSTGAWAADSCTTQIEAGDQMTYSRASIQVPASCKTFTVELIHSGSLPKNVMGHNWVLTRSTDASAVDAAGMNAGEAKGYLPEGDERIIAHTKMLGGGEKDSVTFDTGALEAGKEYTFFCSFPGHFGSMRGVLQRG